MILDLLGLLLDHDLGAGCFSGPLGISLLFCRFSRECIGVDIAAFKCNNESAGVVVSASAVIVEVVVLSVGIVAFGGTTVIW